MWQLGEFFEKIVGFLSKSEENLPDPVQNDENHPKSETACSGIGSVKKVSKIFVRSYSPNQTHYFRVIFGTVQLNNNSSGPKSGFFIIFTLSFIFLSILRYRGIEIQPNRHPKPCISMHCMDMHGFGCRFGWISRPRGLKMLKKLKLRMKIMKNPDFGPLELLFSCTVSNITQK